MIRLSLNLPKSRRLDVSLVKRRAVNDTPLFPSLGKIRRTRAGSKFSRYFRHIFEHKKIQKFLGANLALMIAVSTFLPTYDANNFKDEEVNTAKVKLVLTTKNSIRYPVDNVKITQGYKFYHPGIDFDGVTGDPVYPISNGVIEGVQYSNYAYGNAILINHDNDITSLYAHLSKILVSLNQEVNTNTIIGKIGATGRASGDHLHLEIRDSGYPLNPLTILP